MNWMPLILLSLLALLFPLSVLVWRQRKAVADAGDSQNIALYRERLAEIEWQLQAGEVEKSQAEELIAEQQRLLLQDMPETTGVEKHRSFGGRKDKLILVSLTVFIPVFAFVLYQQLGASDDQAILALMERRVAQPHTAQQDAPLRRELIGRVTQKLAGEPDQPGYLVMLARLHLEDGAMADAVQRYRQAAALLDDNAEVLAEYAQAIYMAEQGRFTEEAEAALESALALDPGNTTALGLKGIRAFEGGNYPQAITSWQTALQRLPAQSQQAAILNAGIQRARMALGDELPGLTVNITLSPALQAAPDQVVYVYARQWQGPPMPLAVARLNVADLPATVKLDDSLAMPGGKPLSTAERVEVIARVSTSGAVKPQAGDLQGASGEIVLVDGASEQPVSLEIDTRLN